MQRHLAIIILIVLLCKTGRAQDYISLETVSSKVGKLHNNAKELLKEEEYEKAASQLAKALVIEPTFIDGYMLLSEVRFKSGDVDQAISAMEDAVSIDSIYHVRNLLSLSRMYELSMRYQDAGEALTSYLRNAELNTSRRDALRGMIHIYAFRDSLMKNPVAFDLEPIAGQINTDADEALPAISIDGSRMIFTRREGRFENLHTSNWSNEQKEWGVGRSISRSQEEYNEGAHAISADGTIMAFTACNRRDALGSCDIYIMMLQENGSWTLPTNLQTVNSSAWDGQPAFSADGRTLYFSSSRKGGQGKRDLWVSRLENQAGNAAWSPPQNLGPNINTSGNESSPYLHYDDRTMYFMSDGHEGMGDYDLFRAILRDGHWSIPTNLGYPINTPGREGAMTIHPDGTKAYYTLESDLGTMDIFEYDLPASLKPQTISYVKGLVYDNKSKMPLSGRVTIFALRDSTIKFNYTSHSDGTFMAAIPHGEKYGIHVTHPDYVFYSEQFEIESHKPYSAIDLKAPLNPLIEISDTGKTDPIILRNVEFETGSARLLNDSYVELQQLKSLLLADPAIRMEIRGYTDNVGDAKSNLELSQKRAESVYRWLVTNGVQPERMTFEGLGENFPIADNDTEAGRQRNRRTEFVILK